MLESNALARIADPGDIETVGQLLHDFNTEFGEPTPSPMVLTDRLFKLIEEGNTAILVAGEVPAGLAIIRFRTAIWSDGLECYLAELYVGPLHRRHGLGKALMTAAIQEARQRGADTMDIGVDQPDIVARRLYESLGFRNRAGGDDGPLMYFYEREL